MEDEGTAHGRGLEEVCACALTAREERVNARPGGARGAAAREKYACAVPDANRNKGDHGPDCDST